MSAPGSFAPVRTILFFPAHRPELHGKGLATGADAVCMDLEDAVPPADKEEARRAVVRTLEEGSAASMARTLVRVNDPKGDDGLGDLRALAGLDRPPIGILVPKVADPDVLDAVRSTAAGREPDPGPFLLPMVETARGLEAAVEIASFPGVTTLVFGGVDLGAELGADGSWESLLYARSRVVHAAAVGGVAAVDTPFLDIRDEAGLREEARRARGLGFGGKLVIHPGQVRPVNEAFTPGAGEVERARRVVDAFDAAGGGVVAVDGRMVDRPVVEAARRTLALAERASVE